MTHELRDALTRAKDESTNNNEEGAASALDALDAAVEQAHQRQPVETAQTVTWSECEPVARGRVQSELTVKYDELFVALRASADKGMALSIKGQTVRDVRAAHAAMVNRAKRIQARVVSHLRSDVPEVVLRLVVTQ
jgi:hypothetical protein